MSSIKAGSFVQYFDDRWYGAVDGVGTEEKILLSVDSSEVFAIIYNFSGLLFSFFIFLPFFSC